MAGMHQRQLEASERLEKLAASSMLTQQAVQHMSETMSAQAEAAQMTRLGMPSESRSSSSFALGGLPSSPSRPGMGARRWGSTRMM